MSNIVLQESTIILIMILYSKSYERSIHVRSKYLGCNFLSVSKTRIEDSHVNKTILSVSLMIIMKRIYFTFVEKEDRIKAYSTGEALVIFSKIFDEGVWNKSRSTHSKTIYMRITSSNG